MVETILKSSETHPTVDPGLVVASTACPFGKLLEVLGKSHTLEILYTLGISSPQSGEGKFLSRRGAQRESNGAMVDAISINRLRYEAGH